MPHDLSGNHKSDYAKQSDNQVRAPHGESGGSESGILADKNLGGRNALPTLKYLSPTENRMFSTDNRFVYCDDSSNSFIQLRFFKTSRGLVPSGGPTMPSFSIRSISRAARPYPIRKRRCNVEVEARP